ncbi:MAG: hypothetical protein IH987_04275, partial [Planctomycetes bacterium]|nr:hypothetical protein [Planctomycetota bacterium]
MFRTSVSVATLELEKILSSTRRALVIAFAMLAVVAGLGCSGVDEAEQNAPSEAISAKPASDSSSFLIIVPDPQSLPYDMGSRWCGELQENVQESVGDEDENVYKNHGAYVAAAARLVSPALEAGEITDECSGCIINQFARSVPIADQESCGLPSCKETTPT